MTSRFLFETNCVSSNYEDMCEMLDEHPYIDITLQTFARAIGIEQWKALQAQHGYDRWLPISRDWHVSYHRGTYKGRRCYVFQHSAIEYIFCETT